LRTALACAGIAGALAVQPSLAQAQVSAALSITNDYRVRGISFSNRRPALSVSLSDDLANGVYMGATAIAQDVTEEDIRMLGDIEYLGYARRLSNGLAWEVGLDRQHYDSYGTVRLRLNYADAYVGLSKGAFSTRLYYSPNYNGEGHSMGYLEANATLRPADAWRVAAHVGVQQAFNHWRGASMKPRYDGRVDVIRSFGRAEVSLGVAQASPDFAPAPKRSHAGVIVGASVYF
jgi:uncharacterized protein (TIGR02001 family)